MRKLLLGLLLFTAVTARAQTLRIAVYQYADNPRTKNLQPLATYLQQQLGIATAVKSYPTVHGLIKGMQTGEVDVAFISTFGYLLLQAGKESHPMLPVAALVAPGAKDNYKTAFVARKDAGIASFESLKQTGAGKRMAFVASGSTSGNLVPRLLLNGVGIGSAEAHFAAVNYAGTHRKALEWLVADSADVAAMGITEWERLDSAQKTSLRVLAFSDEIPLGPVLLNKNLNKKLRENITRELLQLHKSDGAALEGIKAAWSEAKQATHFIAIQSNYYNPYLAQFGEKKMIARIIQQFIQ
ncbi:MAG TPA: phosphate/phosphite/phosphonate ABC transporter substrate-binding protein [Flavisolibacter sp.]|nr:phosphate/phosphite/phosphonate ABC transporter substrate-binding protein [Flavisolibacter sp.]